MRKLLIVLLSLFSLSAFAATPAPASGTQDNTSRADRMIQMRLDRMQKVLNLTTDQRNKLQGIYEHSMQQHKAINEDTAKQVDGVLTKEQLAELKKRAVERREKMEERRHDWMEKHPPADQDDGH
jgi:Spy/CpxP family protein refolding chaperone